MDKKKKNKIKMTSWILTVVLSVILIFIFNRIFIKDTEFFGYEDATLVAKVTEIGEVVYDTNDSASYTEKIQYFYAKVLKGERRGEILLCYQETNNYSSYEEEPVSVGNKVMLYENEYSETDTQWLFGGYYRINFIIFLAFLFLALVLFFGREKGVNTIISLAFTILAVFLVFVPAVLQGRNIYVMTVCICIYTIIMTLLLVSGPTAKSVTTIIGCSFGVLVSAAITVIFIATMHLTGVVDEHSIYLMYLSTGVSIDLKALIFAMTTIGALGAVMDVAMDISSSLSEIHKKLPNISFKELFDSGLRIGRDIMGTMANTLVLAYVGSGLCSTLLMVTYSTSMLELMNREGVVVELLQTVVGSLSLLLTIPLTSLVCAYFYIIHGRKPGSLQLSR